jgi:hypothetical protein
MLNYFNRRALSGFIAKRYAEVLHRGRQYVESAEANESQGILIERLGTVGDAALGPISLQSGGTLVVDIETGVVRVGEAVVWAGGYMHQVPEATLTGVPMVGITVIGIAVTSAVITEIEDVQLKGIVPNSKSHGEPLGARRRYDAVWARSGDPFYPIYTLVDGLLPSDVATPQDTSAERAVERHIIETHGSHISEGFRVSPGGFNPTTHEQTLIIGAGILRAFGRRVSRSVDQRFRRAENPALMQVNGETHGYPAGGVVKLNNGPIDSVQTVTVVKEVTRTITHQLAGGTDTLPDTPVYSIQSVTQGGTTYAAGTSFNRVGDGISWSPAGPEPAPGTSYTVTFRYTATVTPLAIGRNTLTLEAAVVDQPVTVIYRYKLPRIDVLAIDLDGNVVYIEGISSKYGAVPPPVPSPLAPLVRISNQWGIDPILEDVDQRKFTEAEVRAIYRTMLNLQDRLSLVELEKDIQERDPSSRKGSFVDPFVSDNQRDLGIAQTAAIVGGELQLPILVTPMKVDIGRAAIMLPFVKEPVQSQPFRTLSRKINKYLNFAPLPAIFEINPAVDRWNITSTSSLSQATASFVQVWAYRPDLLYTDLYGTTSTTAESSTTTALASSSTTEIEFLRQTVVDFSVSRMGPGETLASFTFDGVDVVPSVTGTKTANGQGVMTGTFTVPANIRAGTKPVVIVGAGGSRAETSFTGQGTLTTEVYVTTTHTTTVATTIDPIGQSFQLEEPRQVTGVRVEFTERGDPANPVILELRAMDGADPSVDTIAEGITPGTFAIGNPNVVSPANWTEIDYRFPTLVRAKDFHFFALLTDDADHSVAVAQLGDQSDPTRARGFDSRLQQWVRRNPAGGDAFDGSNGRSWVVLPDTDMTYEIMAARYTSLTRTVALGTFDLGDINAGGISDLMVLLIVQLPTSDCKVRIEMVRQGGEVISFEPNTRLQFESYLTEEVTMRMVLTGTARLSPIVMPECQILWGRMEETAIYVSEAIAIDLTNGPAKVRSVVEVSTPGSSSIAVSVGGTGAWTVQTAPLAISLGDEWIEREYLQSPVATAEVREKIELHGTPKDRPKARQLRVRATEV